MSKEDEIAAEVAKGMAEFRQRAIASLPQVPEPKPFEVRVDVQQTLPTPFRDDEVLKKKKRPPPPAFGPKPPGITSVTPNIVVSSGGTTVTIDGDNFVNGATVKIADHAASSVVFVSATRLTCVTPANGLGYVNVEVTNPSGQVASNPNLLQYTDFPDNFVLQGQHDVTGYQGCALGPDYTYTVTARLGGTNFTPPPGVTVYAWIGVYQDAGSCGLENPFQVVINNSTGPTVARTIAFSIHAVTPGVYGNATAYFAIWASRNGSIGTRFPTYGDTTYQPTAFRINIAGNGPPPVGGTSGFFSWSGTNPNSGHFNPWSWDPGELIPTHTITLKKLNPDGTLDTTYNGTATLTHTQIGGTGSLTVNRPATVTFVSGQVSFGLSASYSYQDVSNSQAYGYFYVTATDGAIHNNTPTCTALNHL
jgi:hypothetical protein